MKPAFAETVPLASETVILVITVSFVLMSSAFVQWYLTEKTIKYLELRDELYTIPSGEFKWHPELFIIPNLEKGKY